MMIVGVRSLAAHIQFTVAVQYDWCWVHHQKSNYRSSGTWILGDNIYKGLHNNLCRISMGFWSTLKLKVLWSD